MRTLKIGAIVGALLLAPLSYALVLDQTHIGPINPWTPPTDSNQQQLNDIQDKLDQIQIQTASGDNND